MGNDLSKIKPASLSILQNPAILAISQDPVGNAAVRRWMYSVNDTDNNGVGTIQMWSGYLNSTTGTDYNDMVIMLVNGGSKSRVLNATLVDIFVDNGPSGSAAQVGISWEVRDLWANRMSDADAATIIASADGETNVTAVTAGRYNATKTSYAEGLLNLDPLLLGNVTTTVAPSGTVTATVDAHGVAVLRLRAVPTAASKRDEL
jgi:alpha-galactosidase